MIDIRKVSKMRRLLIVLSIFWLMNMFVSAQDDLSPYEVALERIAQADASGAIVLNLNYLGLSEIPPEIVNLPNLEALYLAAMI